MADAEGESGGPGFEIRGNITAVSPVGQDDLIVGEPYWIQWTPVGGILKFKVEYSYVAGDTADWNEITPVDGVAGETVGGDKKWQWPAVLDTISNNVRFRVSDDSNGDTEFITDSGSPSANTIKGKLSIVSPAADNVWTVGTVESPSIRWNKTGDIGNLKIEYSVSGTFTEGDYTDGNVYTVKATISSGNDGDNDYDWQSGVILSPAVRKLSNTGRIKITNLSPPSGTELEAIFPTIVSGKFFTIEPAFPAADAFSQPLTNGDTEWYANDTDTVNQIIIWTSTSGMLGGENTGPVAPACYLQYSTNQSDYITIPGADALGCTNGENQFLWSPMVDLKSPTVDVKVVYTNYSEVAEASSALFEVRPKIVVTLTETKLTVGETYTSLVKWTYSGNMASRYVDILYDTNSGAGGYPSEQEIANHVLASSGETGVTWSNVPPIIGTGVRIKVFDDVYTDAAGQSSVFPVVGGISNISPAGGVNRPADTTMNVQWNYTGVIGSFNIYYSPSSGSVDSYDLIGNLAANGTTCPGDACTFSWLDTEPNNTNAVLNTGRIKIDNALEKGVNPLYVEVEAPTDFKRGASISNLLVENGPNIEVGSTTTNILWTKDVSTPNATQMKIEYTNNASTGVDWNVLTAETDNDGSFTWPLVPGDSADLDGDVRVKITQVDPDNDLVTFTTPDPLYIIRAKIDVSVPTGDGVSESWGLQTTHDITFSKKGALTSVNIYYA
ncbi:MAG: hypothetical protein KAR32_10640, partial [Candidatus Omnitrophica bacterium]|nr:hypothetical protein [Candidatus Omnitrophota bacterium]